MNISSTSFEFNYYSSQKAGNWTHGEYILHNVDVWNEIVIEGERFTAMYQTGMSYDYNDYNCPCPKLEISEDGGSHPLIVLIDNLWECDFEENGDTIKEALEAAQQHCKSINTVDDLHELYDFLRSDQLGNASDYVPDEFQSDNLDDYEADEETGDLIPKEKQQPMLNDIFARINDDGNADILYKEDGEAVCRFDETMPTLYPVDSNFSTLHEHPRGIVLTVEDAKAAKIEFE